MSSPRATSPVQFELRDLLILAAGLSVGGAALRDERLGVAVAAAIIFASTTFFLIRLKLPNPKLKLAIRVLVIWLLLPTVLIWANYGKLGDRMVLLGWAVPPFGLGAYLGRRHGFGTFELMIAGLGLELVALPVGLRFGFGAFSGWIGANLVGFFVYLPFVAGCFLGMEILSYRSKVDALRESHPQSPAVEPPADPTRNN